MSEVPGYQRFFAELKRRRVFRVMAVYGVVGFVLLFRSEYRGFLLSWRSVLIHLLMVIAPVVWLK